MKVLSNVFVRAWRPAPDLGDRFFGDVDLAMQLVEGYPAIFQSEKSVVAAHADVCARVEASAALANDDVTRDDDFAAEFLDAEAFGIAIAPVA